MNDQYLSKFQIVGTSVKKLKIKNDFIIFDNNNNLKRKIDVSHEIISIDILDERKTFFGILLLNIQASISSGKKKYVIDVSIEGSYEAPVELGEENFREMLQLNGITSLYSIARGFIQSVSSQTLASGSILLPMFNVASYSKDLNLEETKN